MTAQSFFKALAELQAVCELFVCYALWKYGANVAFQLRFLVFMSVLSGMEMSLLIDLFERRKSRRGNLTLVGILAFGFVLLGIAGAAFAVQAPAIRSIYVQAILILLAAIGALSIAVKSRKLFRA